ncbi:PE-PGRS family protein [Kitasatospora sp. NPDC088391]|uniref:5-methylcytosine restriction system specificity protein McrC n=1 Tax=Kitasatospora sp. NPDC088391 TaxID=3364074 RepID=UPI003830E95C
MRDRRTGPPEVEIGEHSTVELGRGQLTEDDVRRLRALGSTGALALRDTRRGWAISTRSVTGILVLDRVRLTLTPKLPVPGDQLITWLCYAHGTPVPHEQTLRRWRTSSTGYADLVLPALLAECQAVLRRGPNCGYRPVDRIEPGLRGQLDIRRQVVRRYGAVDRLHVRTHERQPVIWENQICGAALAAAVRLAAGRPALARELAAVAAGFPNPRLDSTATRLLDRARYTRVNQHYRAAHAWSALVLRGGGVSDLLDHRGHRAGSLLLSVDRLWELVVGRMAEDAARRAGGRAARPDEGRIVTLGGLPPGLRSFRPDTLLAFDHPGPTRFLAVDAKHKDLQNTNVDADDRHQLLTYIAGYTTPAAPVAAIVHPARSGTSHRTLRVLGPRGPLGAIEVFGLDTRLPPEQAARPLREFIASFAAPAGSP